MFTKPVCRHALWFICISYLCSVVGGCAFLKNSKVDAVVGSAEKLIPASLVAEALSIVAFQGALELAKEEPQDKQAAEVQRVRDVVDKLLVSEPKLKQESTSWSIHIIDSDARDAVAFAGAGILVYRGLLDCDDTCLGKAVAPARAVKHRRKSARSAASELAAGPAANERVLAVALSHEISHLRAKHFEQRLRDNASLVKDARDPVLAALVASVKANGLKLPRTKAELAASLANVVIPGGALKQLLLIAGFSVAGEAGGHPFMVEQELASDCAGSGLMKRAGYDPADALGFWSSTISVDAGLFFPTHPLTPQRLTELDHCIHALGTPNEQTSPIVAVSNTHP